MPFPDVLKRMRESRHYSQKHLAELAGITDRAVSHYELGKSVPSLEIAYKLARALDIKWDDFFTDPFGIGLRDASDPYDSPKIDWEENMNIMLGYIYRMFCAHDFTLQNAQRFLNSIICFYFEFESDFLPYPNDLTKPSVGHGEIDLGEFSAASAQFMNPDPASLEMSLEDFLNQK